MNPLFALKILKRLVSEDKFSLVNRRASHAQAVSKAVAKIVINQLEISDFVRKEEDRDFPNEFVWIYKTEFEVTYYIKCKFSSNLNWVKFISFHEALY